MIHASNLDSAGCSGFFWGWEGLKLGACAQAGTSIPGCILTCVATIQVAIGMGRWISTSWHSGKVLCIRVRVARGQISGLLEAEFHGLET